MCTVTLSTGVRAAYPPSRERKEERGKRARKGEGQIPNSSKDSRPCVSQMSQTPSFPIKHQTLSHSFPEQVEPG